MKSCSREFLHRAIHALIAAIDVYNKPDFSIAKRRLPSSLSMPESRGPGKSFVPLLFFKSSIGIEGSNALRE